MANEHEIDPLLVPSGPGCAECEADGGWWVHLRRCATCGHVGCCDSSPSKHATAHYRATGHPVIQSVRPGRGLVLLVPGRHDARRTAARAAGQPAR